MNDQEKTCGSCRHFRRHYVFHRNLWFLPLKVGHCVTPWCRDKREDTLACWRYCPEETPNFSSQSVDIENGDE